MNRDLMVRYVRDAKRYISADQLRNFLRAGIVLQPKQLEFAAAARRADGVGATEIGFGGARGGGKSFVSLAQLLVDDCVRRSGLKVLFLRKSGVAGREKFEELRRVILGRVPHVYARSRGIVTLQNGSLCVLGYFQKDSDVDRYLGLEYDASVIEEATQLSRSKVEDIGTCVRTAKLDWRARIYYTTNPGGVGHSWFYKRFIQGDDPNFFFIQSLADDNSFLSKDYVSKLDRLSGWKLKAWRKGDWNVLAGTFFVEYERARHVRVIVPQPHWTYWGALDYGFNHYTVFYLLAKDDDGNYYLIDEHAARRTQIRDHVRLIKDLLIRHDLDLSFLCGVFAGHDCFAVKHDGQTIEDKYSECGLVLERAIIDRVQGAARILDLLGEDRVTISPNCRGLTNTLPLLKHSRFNGEDVQKWDADAEDDARESGDDFYDAFRYGIMSEPVIIGSESIVGDAYEE